MGEVFCVANQKGGVGKTTTATTLADAFAKSSAKTLLIDFDPQCNATSGLKLESLKSSSLIPQDDSALILSETIIPTYITNLDMLPGSSKTADVELLLRTQPDKAMQLHEAIEQTVKQYDYVLFDCPPSLGHLTQLALFSSTEVLIPIQCEFFAMDGLAQILQVVQTVKVQKPEKLKRGSILLTMYDASLEVTYEVEQSVRKECNESTFKTVIPRDVTFTEAQSYGQSILDYAPRSHGARAYIELCKEIMRN